MFRLVLSFVFSMLFSAVFVSANANAMECKYKLTIGSAAMIDYAYQVDADATYVSPDAQVVKSLHQTLRALGYSSETQDAREASVWVDLTASSKRVIATQTTLAAYQLTVKNNLTAQFARLSESVERSKNSKAQSQLKKKVSSTPKLVAEEVPSCPSNL